MDEDNKGYVTNWVAALALLVVALLFVLSFSSCSTPVQAQDSPPYGTFSYSTATFSGVPSTVAEELLAAPGTGYRWVITGVNRETLVAEASKAIQILDHSGSTPAGATTGATSVAICEFAPTTAGQSAYHDFGTGIACATNSAVMIEGITCSTADVWIQINAYKEYTGL